MKILSWDLYFTSMRSNQLNVFWNVGYLRKRFRVATFLFAENVYSNNALGKITSKTGATISYINKPCSVLSTPFDLNGNSNIWLCYSYWKNVSVFVNCNSTFQIVKFSWHAKKFAYLLLRGCIQNMTPLWRFQL